MAGRSWLVWIEGEPGAGKTALLNQAVRCLPEQFQVIRATADQMSGDLSFGLARQLGSVSGDAPFVVGLGLLESWAVMQDRGAVAVVVEDLHWADLASHQALLAAVSRLDAERVLVIITARPVADNRWDRLRFDHDRCRQLSLPPLSRDEVAALAAASGLPLTQAEAERLRAHTQGLPLYVRMLLAELTLAQLQAPDGQLPAPRTLALTTIAALFEQPEDVRRLASALAVVNGRTPLHVVGRIAGVDDPVAALEGLLATGLVDWRPYEAETSIEFAHPLFRSAVYEDLSPTRRRDLHRAAALHVSAVPALAHRAAASVGADDHLANELHEAAKREAARSAAALSARYLLWASSLSSRPEQSEDRLLEAADVLLRDGQLVQAAILRNRIESCRDTPMRDLLLGTIDWFQGDAASAEHRLLAAASTQSDKGAVGTVTIRALVRLGEVYSTLLRAQDAIDVSSQVLAVSVDGDAERLAWSYLARGRGTLGGAPAGLAKLVERLPQPPEEVAEADVDLLVTRGYLAFYAGRTVDGIADLRAAIRLVRRGAVASELPRSHLQLSWLLVNSGEWDEALVQARVALSLVSEERLIWMQAQAFSAMATVLGYRGEWSAADDLVIRASDAAEQHDSAEATFTARIARASVARARQRPREVVQALSVLAAHPSAIPMVSSLGWWTTLIDAIIECGDLDDAARQTDDLRRAADDRGLAFDARISWLKGRQEAGRNHPKAAVEQFEEAVRLMGADDPLLDRAMTHHGYGRLLQRTGDRKGANNQLQLAHRELSAAGASPFLIPLEADLGRGGLRPPPTSRSTVELTDRERDVVALVARGLTNREAGAELYISAKAVDYHLRNIFGKLGIHSRRELRDRNLVQV
jgi:DNA-binding CsgD family transcriptional regulator